MEELCEQINQLRQKIDLDSPNSLVFAPAAARSTGELARGENKQKDPVVEFELEEKLEDWILRRQEQKLEVLKDVEDDSQLKLKDVMDASQLKLKKEVEVAYGSRSEKSSATSSSVSGFGSAKTVTEEMSDIVEVQEEPVPFWAKMSGDELARQIDCIYMEEIQAVEEDLRSEVTWTSRREEVCHQSGIEASIFATRWYKARFPSVVPSTSTVNLLWTPNSET